MYKISKVMEKIQTEKQIEFRGHQEIERIMNTGAQSGRKHASFSPEKADLSCDATLPMRSIVVDLSLGHHRPPRPLPTAG